MLFSAFILDFKENTFLSLAFFFVFPGDLVICATVAIESSYGARIMCWHFANLAAGAFWIPTCPDLVAVAAFIPLGVEPLRLLFSWRHTFSALNRVLYSFLFCCDTVLRTSCEQCHWSSSRYLQVYTFFLPLPRLYRRSLCAAYISQEMILLSFRRCSSRHLQVYIFFLPRQ